MNKGMFPKSSRVRHTKGQIDHVDAWLMSYADLITLLFMLFVIFISVSVSRQNHSPSVTMGEPEHPVGQHKSGTLELGTPFDEAYRILNGFVMSHHEDQSIALEKNKRGIALDISAIEFFDAGSAEIPLAQLPKLKALAKVLKAQMPEDATIEVEGHTDGDVTTRDGEIVSGWKLAALRSARIVELLQEAGIPMSSLRATSYAGARPLVPNQDAAGNRILENNQRNQRMVIRMESAS